MLLLLAVASCKEKRKHIRLDQKQVVERPEQLKATVSDILASAFEDALDSSKGGRKLPFRNVPAMASLYKQKEFLPLWSHDSLWLGKSDSLVTLLHDARRYGLFPQDYGLRQIDSLLLRARDTARANRLDAALWAQTDLYLTAALVDFSTDLKVSRLQPDSVRRRDSSLRAPFFDTVAARFGTIPADSFTRALEPAHHGYWELRAVLDSFLPKAVFRSYTSINPKDTLRLRQQLRKRLSEDSIRYDASLPDSLAMATMVRHYQKRKGLKTDGRISPELITRLNMTDADKFAIIAVNLDRYKQLPPMPAEYIWVNLPAYQLQVVRGDSVTLTSKVVVGKPETRTPQLISAVNNMMTYPQWTIPPSIIAKDILPALQRDPGYLARRNFSLLDENRNEVNPYTVKWSKYKKEIPYKVVQGSGDDNALGVLKFNFPNDYSVYLHDTNQRSFFGRSKRALSHGCVRVESWHDLATYLLRRDSTLLALDSTAKAKPVRLDSLDSWLAQKKRQYVPLRRPMPVYLRYFTAVCREGKLLFYEDIYGEDRRLRQAYLTRK
ncbi:L,D-transpeptidase family protein [Flaviaesturariibacter terrae]